MFFGHQPPGKMPSHVAVCVLSEKARASAGRVMIFKIEDTNSSSLWAMKPQDDGLSPFPVVKTFPYRKTDFAFHTGFWLRKLSLSYTSLATGVFAFLRDGIALTGDLSIANFGNACFSGCRPVRPHI